MSKFILETFLFKHDQAAYERDELAHWSERVRPHPKTLGVKRKEGKERKAKEKKLMVPLQQKKISFP